MDTPQRGSILKAKIQNQRKGPGTGGWIEGKKHDGAQLSEMNHATCHGQEEMSRKMPEERLQGWKVKQSRGCRARSHPSSPELPLRQEEALSTGGCSLILSLLWCLHAPYPHRTARVIVQRVRCSPRTQLTCIGSMTPGVISEQRAKSKPRAQPGVV